MFKSAKKIIVIVFTAFLGISAFAESTHLVKKGETLYGIAKKYQITISELKAANNLSDKDVLKAGQKLVIPSADIENAATLSSTNSSTSTSNSSSKTETYIVQKGDTLYGIAKKYDINVNELKSYNNLTSNLLTIGQTLLIPKTSEYETYIVVSGDSLYKIANKYNTTVDKLKSVNNLKNDNLSIGQVLIIPN